MKFININKIIMITINEYINIINDKTLIINNEIWQVHPKYNDLYGSNLGRIKKLNSKKEFFIKKQTLDKRYYRFKINVYYGKMHLFLDSARFICECFNGCNDELFVDHIDSNPFHNNITNLRFVTRKENNNNINSKKKYKPSKTTNHCFKIEQINIETKEIIKIWDKCKDIEEELNLPFNARKNIFAVCNGRQKTAYGYIWKYHEENNLDGEIWVKHPHLDIETSNKGRVRWKRKNGLLYITSGGKHSCGYLTVQYENKKYLVHRLIAETFLENKNNKPYINHIDCNPYNNVLENLEWCTASENMLSENTHKKTSIRVSSIDDNGNIVKTYSSIKMAVKEGYHSESISKCLKGIYKKHKGLKWIYS